METSLIFLKSHVLLRVSFFYSAERIEFKKKQRCTGLPEEDVQKNDAKEAEKKEENEEKQERQEKERQER